MIYLRGREGDETRLAIGEEDLERVVLELIPPSVDLLDVILRQLEEE